MYRKVEGDQKRATKKNVQVSRVRTVAGLKNVEAKLPQTIGSGLGTLPIWDWTT